MPKYTLSLISEQRKLIYFYIHIFVYRSKTYYKYIQLQSLAKDDCVFILIILQISK